MNSNGVTLLPAGVVTTIPVGPEVCEGVVHVIVVSFKTTTFDAATPPKVTPAFPKKLEPEMVTVVPPSVLPPVGAMNMTIGGGGGTKVNSVFALFVPPGVVTKILAVPAA